MSEEELTSQTQDNPNGMTRRGVLKGLLTLPFAGAFAYGLYKKNQFENLQKNKLLNEIDLSYESPEFIPPKSSGKKIRLGIIGYGIRGSSLVHDIGFIHPERMDKYKEGALKNKQDTRYQNYKAQENLNIEIKGVCDVFDGHAEDALKASANIYREGTKGKMGEPAKRYLNYKELLAADDIDAVIIATPDHWHAQMTIDAANAGKHVYCEKPLTNTLEEVYRVNEAVKRNGIIFQLGHQGRQTESYVKAREAIKKNILGKVTLIQVATNRNSPNGAWVYDIDPRANKNTIDWQQFLGNAPQHEFSLERFFRWRCWWDYATGLTGDLLTHEYDAINQVMGVGIPKTVSASGGIYFYKDGRDVPDIMTVALEYPHKDLSILYTASLASNNYRGKVLMGHDATMELGNKLFIKADRDSTQYKKSMEKGIIDPNVPIYSYIPGRKSVDAITSPTEQYFANRGLLYTYRGGKRYNTTFLHLSEWLDCIRTKKTPSCDIDQAFDEAIVAQMATIAYREKKVVEWDEKNQVLIGYEKDKENALNKMTTKRINVETI